MQCIYKNWNGKISLYQLSGACMSTFKAYKWLVAAITIDYCHYSTPNIHMHMIYEYISYCIIILQNIYFRSSYGDMH